MQHDVTPRAHRVDVFVSRNPHHRSITVSGRLPYANSSIDPFPDFVYKLVGNSIETSVELVVRGEFIVPTVVVHIHPFPKSKSHRRSCQ